MRDTGFMRPPHPYYDYAGRNYSIASTPDPDDPNPDSDDTGHGTGMTACALAVAPRVRFTMYKVYSPLAANPNALGAFSRAVNDNPHIITCSWGTIYSDSLQIAIAAAVANGIVVFFACGNARQILWPGSERAVISVGGAYELNLTPEASNYASSGINPDSVNNRRDLHRNDADRQVPDLCGICGPKPSGYSSQCRLSLTLQRIVIMLHSTERQSMTDGSWPAEPRAPRPWSPQPPL